MNMEVDTIPVSDEQYVIQRAKIALKTDPISAKAWMITAKTLYPNNFGVQFEAYRIEKSAGHVKEAAKCFTDLIGKFQEQPEFWDEINHVTLALRTENDCTDPDKMFLTKMFKHISLDVQHKLLLLTANHSDDTIEHCKLLLLFLQRFPSAIVTHGPGLVETLLSAEKHCHASNQPVNNYRKLLVCDLLPMLSLENNIGMEMSTKMIYKLLHKTIEYHLCILSESLLKKEKLNTKYDESWINLFKVVEFVGKQLGWEVHLTNFSTNWSKEVYLQKLMTFHQAQTQNLEDPNILRQFIYCLTLFLIYCLHQYIVCMNMEMHPTLGSACSYLLIDAFIDSSISNTQTVIPDVKAKRRKSDADSSLPFITTEITSSDNITSNFLLAINCWDVLNSTEQLSREYVKLTSCLNLDAWLSNFMIDYYIYKGRHDEALERLHQTNEQSPLVVNLLMANIFYLKANYIASFEHILLVMTMLPTNMGSLSNQLVVGGTQRHLHFIPLTNLAILQYCTKLLLASIRENVVKQGAFSDLAIGHSLVLMQLNWAQEEAQLPGLIEQISRHGAFHYYLFQAYIVQVDILEELAYLWSAQGGSITLDILPHLGQRRIGTRGADKGVKEEIKLAMRRQIMRCNEPIHVLIHTFITMERVLISQTLVSADEQYEVYLRQMWEDYLFRIETHLKKYSIITNIQMICY